MAGQSILMQFSSFALFSLSHRSLPLPLKMYPFNDNVSMLEPSPGAKLLDQPQVAVDMLGVTRRAIVRETLRECGEEDQLIRRMAIHGGARTQVFQQCRRYEATDRL